jgi:hypothetical protein
MIGTTSRELYNSPNGDRWYLVREAHSSQPMIVHEPNVPSGGATSMMSVCDFLARGHGPEQQELLRLIGTLIEPR